MLTSSSFWNAIFRGRITGRNEKTALAVFNAIVLVFSLAVWLFFSEENGAPRYVRQIWMLPTVTVLSSLIHWGNSRRSKER